MFLLLRWFQPGTGTVELVKELSLPSLHQPRSASLFILLGVRIWRILLSHSDKKIDILESLFALLFQRAGGAASADSSRGEDNQLDLTAIRVASLLHAAAAYCYLRKWDEGEAGNQDAIPCQTRRGA